MPATRPARWILLLAALGSLLSGAPALASGDDAHAWLARMATATRALNYDGTFVYHSGDWMQSMRIIHRASPDGGQERLVALTGEPREVLRDRSTVTCILPDDRSVVVGKSRSKGLAGSPVFEPDDGFARNYELDTRDGERVAGRRTQLIQVRPRDEYRYGYDLYVDVETGLLLKSVLRAPQGEVLEAIEFTSITTPAEIPDELLEPSISSEGFTLFASTGEHAAGNAEEGMRWQTTWLPEGFAMAEAESDLLPTSRMPVDQFVYSDGLASLSVFIEPLDEAAEKLDGPSRMGAVHAYGVMIDEYQITAVGEVPAETVRKVAQSVRPI